MDSKDRQSLEFLRAHRYEISPFHWNISKNEAMRLLVLQALILELPKIYFLKMHEYDSPSETFCCRG